MKEHLDRQNKLGQYPKRLLKGGYYIDPPTGDMWTVEEWAKKLDVDPQEFLDRVKDRYLPHSEVLNCGNRKKEVVS